MRLNLKSSAIVCAVITTLLFMTGCNKSNAAAATSEETESFYAVNTYRTAAGNLDDYLEFGGDVASVSSVDVLPDQAGKITNILVSVGDKVYKNQILAYVNPMRAGVVYADSPVRAPIAGRITSLPPTIGATVSQSTAIAKISRTDDLEIRISIAERFISRIENGQAANVTFDAYPSVVFKAKVFEVSPVLDTSTRTMGVKLRLDPPDDRIKVGMYGRVSLITESIQNAIVIPTAAIVDRDGKSYVFIAQRGGGNATVKLQQVTLGLSVDNKTEITQGLSAGEEIVIKGQTLLNDGSKVNIISVTESD